MVPEGGRERVLCGGRATGTSRMDAASAAEGGANQAAAQSRIALGMHRTVADLLSIPEATNRTYPRQRFQTNLRGPAILEDSACIG